MKEYQHKARRGRILFFGLFALIAAITLLAIPSLKAYADNVNIVDNAHVLDVTQVTNEASQLPNPVSIYTNKSFTGSNDAFDTFTTTFIGPNDSSLIVINIDTVHRHLAIVGGTQVALSNDQYAAAIQAFKDNFNNGDYTGATIAALQSLNTALTPLPDSNGNGFVIPPDSTVTTMQVPPLDSGPDTGSLMALLVLGFIIVFGIAIMRRLIRSAVGTGPVTPVKAQPLDATPFEAGALGTSLGGMAGYELAQEEMERQNRERIQQQMFNNYANNFPNANAGNPFGSNIGGASGDFGGGNIGGGSSGNF